MKKTIIKSLSVILALILTLTSAPLSGLVGLELPEWLDFSIESSAATYSGTCGTNVTWSYNNSTYVLTISGTGAMTNYSLSNRPWESHENSIKTIVIEDGVTSIGTYAFFDFGSLTSVTIPDSVTSIGIQAFYYTAYYNDTNNWQNNVLYINNHLIDVKTNITGDYEIKDGTITIADCAFEFCDSLTSITIPDSVTSIGRDAFYECTSLTSISIPDNVTTIADWAFGYCKSLTSITIPDSVISIGSWAFSNCTSLTSITIPDSVTSIGYCAFGGCTSLTSVTIGDSLTSIGGLAFYGCDNLISIIVDSNNQIYSNDEYGVLFKKDKTILIQYPIGNTRTSYAVPDTVTVIDDYAFHGCNSLTNVTIPDSVTSIGDSAFYGCSSLTNVTIPDNVTLICHSAFRGCTNLTSITIPDNVTTIGDYAFAYCVSLTSITVDSNNQYYTSDEDGVLFNKDRTTLIQYPVGNTRTSYAVPDTVTVIDDYAFHGCNSLTNVTIPDSVTSIGDYAFSKCTILESVTIPESVTTISYSAFESCYSLTDVYYAGAEKEWNLITISLYNDPLLNATIHYNYCDHNYETIITAPTCTEQGYTTYKCSACGDTYIDDYVDALGHTAGEIVEEDYIAPTCTLNGSKDNVTYCTVCNEETSRETVTIPALGHTEEEIVAVAPTCTETGLTVGIKCSVCDEVLEPQQEVPVLGHDIITDEAVAPDCTNTGLTSGEHCSRCDYKVEQTVVDALGHKYESVVTAPTCTSQGYTTYTCYCGDTYKGDFVDALTHNYKDGICIDCETPNPTYFTFEIQEPSRTTIRCNDGIKLHTKITGNLPDGSRIEWNKNNSNFNMTTSASGNEITIISKNNGYTTFTATVYDADNNVIAQDTIEMYSKAGLFDKIGGFFRSLFGTTKIYEN